VIGVILSPEDRRKALRVHLILRILIALLLVNAIGCFVYFCFIYNPYG